MQWMLREAWYEFRAGWRSGVLPLIYVVLTAYISIVMTNGDNLRNMGAVDVARNSPALVYLMTSGDAFFLLFAWAWIFAQPIVRDRQAHLHEIVLAAPISLRTMLCARYLGALAVALILGTSQVVGFLLLPLLEMMHILPAGSVAAPPWGAFAWAGLLFTLPLAAGAGALYFVAAVRTRGVGGPFAIAALLMAMWMVAMIVFKGGHADPFITVLFDPTGFAEVEHQVVDQWTPHEKNTAYLALTPGLALNRLIWGFLPILLLLWCLYTVRREHLLDAVPRLSARGHQAQAVGSDQAAAHAARESARAAQPAREILSQRPSSPSWWRCAVAETSWQIKQLFAIRGVWLGFPLMLLIGVGGGLVHGMGHAYGPMLPYAEYVSPVLTKVFYLILMFIVAAFVGVVVRRDEQAGLTEMFDATPAPSAVRLLGRVGTIAMVCVLCVAVPSFGAIVVGIVFGPTLTWQTLWLPFVHQSTVLLPAVLELAAITLLLHTLIRRAGVAHAAAILAAFIVVVNFEVGLISYPPLQIGRGMDITLSGLTGFTPWLEKIAAQDSFKILLVLVLIVLANVFLLRGVDWSWKCRLTQWRKNIDRPKVAVLLLLCSLMGGVSVWLSQRFIDQGGYEDREQSLAKDARWEQVWLADSSANPLSLNGGKMTLKIDKAQKMLHGHWRLDGVHSKKTGKAFLYAALPYGFALQAVQVNGQAVQATADDDLLRVGLPSCPVEAPCEVTIEWTISTQGWQVAEDGNLTQPSWLVGNSYWLRARDVAPILGLDASRLLRAPGDRQALALPKALVLPGQDERIMVDAIAPAGAWSWQLLAADTAQPLAQGQNREPLDFAVFHAPDAQRSTVDGMTLIHDDTRFQQAQHVAQDVLAMSQCVSQRLQVPLTVPQTVVQWPRGLPLDGDAGSGITAALSGRQLLLAEEPHWDVAEQGTGRWVRRAEIARALVRQLVIERANLHEGPGSLWLSDGLPGAVGLLCVAQTDGVAALSALLARHAQQTTEALAGATVPIGTLAQAQTGEWTTDYAPVAALAWTARLTPAKLDELLLALSQSGDYARTLADHFDESLVQTWLGAPRAIDVQVRQNGDKVQLDHESWHWHQGGWQDSPAASLVPLRLQSHAGQLYVNAEHLPAETPSIYLADGAYYERAAQDNLLRHPQP